MMLNDVMLDVLLIQQKGGVAADSGPWINVGVPGLTPFNDDRLAMLLLLLFVFLCH